MDDRTRPGPQSTFPPRSAGSASGSVTELIRGIATDLGQLVRQEIRLGRREVGDAVVQAKAGLVSLAIGAALAFLGLGFLLLAAVYALARHLEPWLAALVVGGAVCGIGLILLGAARRRLRAQAFVPDRSLRALRKDEQLIRRTAS